jgi:SAM-dependent methyltransferase
MIFSSYLYLAHRLDRLMARRFCPRLDGIVLDVGCGRRPFQGLLPPGARYIGMDYNADVEPDVVGSVLALPFRDGAVDGVMCNEVLEHVAEPSRALDEICRVLRPGGLAYITVPQAWGLHYEPHDYFRFTPYGLRYLLEKSHFELVETRRMGGLFTYFAVRVIDMIVLDGLFPLMRKVGINRGRYRISALMVLPLTILLIPCTTVLDRLDKTNAYGWAILARKPDSETDPTSPHDESKRGITELLACPTCRHEVRTSIVSSTGKQATACVACGNHVEVLPRV